MPTIIPTLSPSRRPPGASALPGVRAPHYECTDLPGALQLLVLVPGIDAGGVDITTRGPDLFLTARKARPVRVNWSALRLEDAQQDYHLALRLGHAFDFAELRASLRDGLLTITLPKAASTLARERQVA